MASFFFFLAPGNGSVFSECVSRAFFLQMSFPDMETFSDELKPGEQPLRGGGLSTPTVLTDLEEIRGRYFIKVCQRNATLRVRSAELADTVPHETAQSQLGRMEHR